MIGRSGRKRPGRRAAWLLLTGAALAAGGVLAERAGLLDPIKAPVRTWIRHHEPAELDWPTAPPAEVGLDAGALDALREDLERWDTRAFLVTRGGSIAYEWYRSDFGPNLLWYTASTAKPIIGGLILALAVELEAVDLDDPGFRYVPEWRGDSLRSRIWLRHLASHSSGIQDVDFVKGAEDDLSGWQERYYEHAGERFRMALERAPIRFEPGTRYEYSGVGYYALADILERALARHGHPDLRAFVRDRLMRPLGIPDDAWRMSYGTSYEVDGRTLYAIGSGGSITARAAARVTHMVMRHGRWDGRQVVDSAVLARMLDPSAVPEHSFDTEGTASPWGAPATGWYLNRSGAWPSLPEDALVAIGNRHQMLLAVPSWDLVAVRLGAEPLGGFDAPARQTVDARFFAPLARAVRAP